MAVKQFYFPFVALTEEETPECLLLDYTDEHLSDFMRMALYANQAHDIFIEHSQHWFTNGKRIPGIRI